MTNASKGGAFLSGSLTRHILAMSTSSAVGFLALFFVDFVDIIFISMLGVQELAAAVGFAGGLLFVTTSVSIGIGIAGGALVARTLGQGDLHRAAELLTNVLIVGGLASFGIAGLIYPNLEGLTGLIGASGETQRLAVSYLKILTPTMPVMLVGIVASAALRSHGAAKLAMIVTLVAGAVNAILDPIFIFWLGMGLDGAAWASVAARLAMAGTAVVYISKKYGGFVRPSVKGVASDWGPIAAIALPAVLANIATPIGSIYVTRAMAEFGQSAVAGMAVIGRVTPIAFAFIFAISGAIGPIIGQNFGAGFHDRVREAFRLSIWVIIAYVLPAVLILYSIRAPLADLFSAEGTARQLIFLFCGPLSLAWIFNGIIFVGNAAYNNLGRPYYSTWINWARNTLGTVPFVYLGAQIGDAEGVLVGQMAGGVIVALGSVVLARHVMRKAEKAPVPRGSEVAFAPLRDAFRITHQRH